jgi:hypothetical protein
MADTMFYMMPCGQVDFHIGYDYYEGKNES